MPRYIIERNVAGLCNMTKVELEEELSQGGKKSNEVIATMTGVVWIRSYISVAEGKIYCEYEAPNPGTLMEHAQRIGMPADKISEVALEIHPGMFV